MTDSYSYTPSGSEPDHDRQTKSSSPVSSQDAQYGISSNDIAIVGMGCRLPGGINSAEALWSFILNKKDASGEIPSMRWEPYYTRDSRNAAVLKKTTSRGYFLDRLEDFDASFFGISPKEAELMDPQQRIALEVTWEALENAGIPPQSLAGSDTAVFMGVNSDDYSRLLLEDLPGVEAWMGIGTAFCGIPNRISYLLDLHGPSSAVDAACASSLVAIHHGRQSLLSGETRIAIVGGVNALAGPGLTSVLDKAGATSSEGRCLSFDESAHGYGRGEGASIVIMKRLSDAIMDKDNVLAVLKGSAVGQDGRTNGIMAPNQKAQEDVARRALRTACIDPQTVAFVEAHATSTPVGDPCEVAAITSVYGSGSGRPSNDPCMLGSVKPNVGHLEAGAGSTSFIKAILAIQHGQFPPQANLKTLNSKMSWDTNLLHVVRETTPWSDEVKPRRAGVCSYGYGGTVAHAVLQQTPHFLDLHRSLAHEVDADHVASPYLLLISAPQANRIPTNATRLRNWLSEQDDVNMPAVATTLAIRRGHHPYRTAILAESKDEALSLLESVANKSNSDFIHSDRTIPNYSHGAVWVFSGHGAHWSDMGKELLKNEPIFHQTLQRIDHITQEILDFSAISALQTGDFESTDRLQAVTYATQVGLAEVLRSKGVVPSAIIGHSLGEISASVVAGCLTLEEGALVACYRAKLYRRVAGQGAMILIDLPYNDAVELLSSAGSKVTAAIHSSPTACVLSGTTEAIAEFTPILEEKSIRVRKVKTDVAFHSASLEQLVQPLMDVIGGGLIDPRPPQIRLYSTSLLDARGQNLRDAQYWVNNMVNPVWLTIAINAAIEDGFRVFLEVSTHPIVSHSINETLIDANVDQSAVIGTMTRNKSSSKSLLMAIAKLHCSGVSISWKDLYPGDWARSVPGTTWVHQPYWRAVKSGPIETQVTHKPESHSLLGLRTRVYGSNTTIWTTVLNDDLKPFPGSHPLHGTEIVPAAVLLNTFLKAAGDKSTSLRNVMLRVPVAISAPRDLQIVIDQQKISLSSRLIDEKKENKEEDSSWLTHTTSQLELNDTPIQAKQVDVTALKSKMKSTQKPSFTIDYLASVGVAAMGFPWAVTEHQENDNEILTKVDVAPESSEIPASWDGSSWAPLLDAATSIGSTVFYRQALLRMPAHIEKVSLLQAIPPKIAFIHVTMVKGKESVANVTVLNEDGLEIAILEGMRFSAVEGTPGANSSVESLVHQLAWPPAKLEENPIPLKKVLFISPSSDTSCLCYPEILRRRGIQCDTIGVADLDSLATTLKTQKTTDSTILVYVPENSDDKTVPELSSYYCESLLNIVKALSQIGHDASPPKLWCITDGVTEGRTSFSLAQAPLLGLSRIIAAEHPDMWGGLVDVDDGVFPLQAIKYVKGADVIVVRDTVARTARLRAIPRKMMTDVSSHKISYPRPESTYLVTGGLGALGLEVAGWLAEKGARRIVLASRRKLLKRSAWKTATDSVYRSIERIETLGASVHVISVDVGAESAAHDLEVALDNLDLPPVMGVVHAAGVLEDGLVTQTTPESFSRVLAPKVSGAMALHQLFPPATLDFTVYFSSCGQLFGFAGQASYASGNAFLDALATYRRNLGDNTLSLLWTSWRGLGMASSTEYIDAELETKGITSISRDEGFRAWEHAVKHDIDQAVVLRVLPIEEDAMPPGPILDEIVVRHKREVHSSSDKDESSSTKSSVSSDIPKSGPELKAYLQKAISTCVASTLSFSSYEDVDPVMALTEMGMDSVMTVSLRRSLQQSLKVKVPPTLIWGHPTVSHLVKWFADKV